MSFLAVVTDFFAESLREHNSERSKEKEYLTSMFAELKVDTTQYRAQLNRIERLNPIFDSCYVNAKQVYDRPRSAGHPRLTVTLDRL